VASRFSVRIPAALVIFSSASIAPAQTSETPAVVSATTVPAAQQVQPAELVKLLNSGTGAPLIIQVGSRVFFEQAHIPGAKYAGPGSQPAGIEALEKTVAAVAKDRFIVLYCGCCPWNRCPNVGPAFQRLHELGYSNVKVLHLANNFGDDWVRKGYPREH
jgi:thiosulfate/3-mercaptopyruvate sulfurtransferase